MIPTEQYMNDAGEIDQVFNELIRKSTLVQLFVMLRVHNHNKISAEDMLKALAIEQFKQNEALTKRVLELEALTPRRIQTSEGILRYDAPDALVPITTGFAT